MAKSLPYRNKECDEIEPEHGDHHIMHAYDRHIDTVYRVCLSLLGHAQDAEDASQNVFVKLMESNKAFVNTEHEKAWLIVTAKNHCRDVQRRWRRKKIVDIDSLSIAGGNEEPFMSEELWGKMLKLPASHRLILYLYYYEGYKLTEIAKMLDVNLNTVKTRMRSAKKRMKLEIGDDFYE